MRQLEAATAYYELIRNVRHRNCKHFIFWADNCTAQNKNWLLYTALFAKMNRKSGLDTITIKCFEKRHFFTSANSFHHFLEKEMSKIKCLYDFDDFISCVSNKGKALVLDYSDNLLFENGVCQGKFTNRSLLESIQCVKSIKGETVLCWKPLIDDNELFSEDFLKQKVAANILKGFQFENIKSPCRVLGYRC